MNSDLVVFGEDWNGHPSSTQHIVRRLTRNRSVLWINSIGLRRPRFNTHDLGRLASKAAALFKPPQVAEPSPTDPHIVNPKAVPFPGSSLARAVNRVLLGRTVRDAMKRRSMNRPILWTSLPSAVDVVGELDERAVVYYCGDDFSALEGVDHGPVALMEEELAERADLILAASPTLAKKFPSEKTQLMPHGVDLDLFRMPKPRAPEVRKDIPVAGFYGSISEWLDFDLLAETARWMPHWQFLFVGPEKRDLSAFKSIPNFTFLGPRNHDELPGYAQHWTVSLLPFADTPQIRACNPLKLREYLAAGKPVVTTDFPALDGYRDLVNVVRSPEDMIKALQAAEMSDPVSTFDRQNRVAPESWDSRAHTVASLLDGLA